MVDTGFSLEDDRAQVGTRPGATTTLAAEVADVVVAVGGRTWSPCPGWRGLVELRGVVGGRPVHVVVNRMRPTLGWSERDVAGWSAVSPARPGCTSARRPADRRPALVAGRTLAELGDSRSPVRSPRGRRARMGVDGVATPRTAGRGRRR